MVAAAAWPQRPLLCVGLLTAAAVCAAGRALVDIDFHFAWQAWRLWMPRTHFSWPAGLGRPQQRVAEAWVKHSF